MRAIITFALISRAHGARYGNWKFSISPDTRGFIEFGAMTGLEEFQ